MISKSSSGAGLERGICALGGRVESVYGGNEGIRILSSTTIVDVNVRVDIAASPEALSEAKDLWCCSRTTAAGLSELSSERGTFDKGTVRRSEGKERGAVDLFPEIESGLIPVANSVSKILCNNWPDGVESLCLSAVVNQPVGINGKCSRT